MESASHSTEHIVKLPSNRGKVSIASIVDVEKEKCPFCLAVYWKRRGHLHQHLRVTDVGMSKSGFALHALTSSHAGEEGDFLGCGKADIPGAMFLLWGSFLVSGHCSWAHSILGSHVNAAGQVCAPLGLAVVGQMSHGSLTPAPVSSFQRGGVETPGWASPGMFPSCPVFWIYWICSSYPVDTLVPTW